ncbi:MAG: alpha/beta fold hydrolase [Polyangiaceae bacterium]|nr:alpha/beta fold hydrolase [Polyangiaceae bacterium]
MLWLVGALLVFCLAATAHVLFWGTHYRLALPYALVEEIPTPDGSAIELRRVTPSEVLQGAQVPVLLVHGIAANHRNLDLDEEHSLARYLAARGLDVWLVTLRCGLPRTPRSLVRLDALRDIDVPLAIAEVLRRTRAESLDVVGFSLGGLLASSALLRRVPEGAVRRLVSLSAPTLVAENTSFWLFARLLASVAGTLPLRTLGLLALPWVHWVWTPVHRLLYNANNMDSRAVNLALANVVQNVATRLIRDLIEARQAGVSEEDWSRIRALNVPVLFITGSRDPFTDSVGTAALCRAWGADTGCVKSSLCVGHGSFGGSDFGHVDLALGGNAARQVFEAIFQFLRS